MFPQLIQDCKGHGSLVIQLEINNDTIQVNATPLSRGHSWLVDSRGAKGFKGFLIDLNFLKHI